MKYILLLFFALNCLFTYTQDYIVHVDKYDLQNGLSNRQVNTICKDSRGLLWIGTHYGLNSYDGYNFKFYTKERDGLPFNQVYKILEDDQGNLLLFGPPPTNDVSSFNPITHEVKLLSAAFPDFKSCKIEEAINAGDDVTYMLTSDNSAVLIYSSKKGLKKKDISALAPFHFLHKGAGNTLYATSNNNVLLHLDSALNVIRKWQLAFDVKPSVYGNSERGFILRVNETFSSNKAYYLDFSDSLRLLNATDLPPRDEEGIDLVFSTEIDGVIWRQGRLYNIENKLITDLVQRGYKDLSNTLRAVYNDNNNVIWIGNDFGLYKVTISKNRFANYFTDSNFKEDNSNSYRGIYTNGANLYSNNEWKGLHTYNIQSKTVNLSSRNEFGGFTCIVPDGEGHLLQGCFYGVNKIDVTNNTAKTIRFGDKDLRLWCMQAINKGLFLCGTEKGLYLYDNVKEEFKAFNQYNAFGDLRTAFVVSIYKVSNGNYWLCTDKGLYSFNIAEGITACYNLLQNGTYKLPVNEVYSICIDDAGITWLGSNEGLIKWDKNRGATKKYTRTDGLSDNTIYTIQSDEQGNLWLGSNYGLMRFNIETEQIKTYLTEDGVSNNEFNRISAYKSKNGALFFGTLNGITSFNPTDFANDITTSKSALIVTSYKKFDSDADNLVDYTGSLLKDYTIKVDVDDKLFTIEYALLNYSYTSQNLYAYKIDGIQNDWVYSKERSLSFSRLPYGNYYMRIKAKALNGSWSDEIVIKVNVLTPFYLQTWFFVLVVVLVLLLIFGYVRLRTYQYKREQNRLEAEVRKKTATITEQSDALKVSLHQKEILLKEIHHRVKNNLQVISGLLSLQGGNSDNNEVKSIMKEGRERIKSMALIHQMLYQHEDLQKLNFKDYLKQLTANILAGSTKNNIDIKIHSADIWFDIDTAIPLGLIVTEFVTNAIKHAFIDGTGNIEIYVQQTRTNEYKLLFKDSGTGLPEGFDIDSARSLGLKLVKMLTAQIKATVNFRNNNGTEIELNFTDNWKAK